MMSHPSLNWEQQMQDWSKQFPPRPFYTAGNRVCSVKGVTIHVCKSDGEALELAHALNTAMNDVLLKPPADSTFSAWQPVPESYGGTTDD
jgi:hypothetical protein